MGLVISLGSGLILGIVLLIWALSERSKRANAEKTAVELGYKAKELVDALAKRGAELMAVAKDRDNANAQVAYLREEIGRAREQLLQCKDPVTVGKLLDQTLKAQLF